MTSLNAGRDVPVGARRPYQKPQAITYGTVAALAMGASGDTEDSNNPHDHNN